MGKNIKSYATTQVHSPGEGREALRQKKKKKSPNLSVKISYNLTVLIRFQITNKIFQIYVLYFGQIYSELRKSHAIHRKYPAPLI